MLTYSGTAEVSFTVPAAGAIFVPAADLVLAPAPGQELGTLSLEILDDNYDFSAAQWSSPDPLLSFSGSGPEVTVLLDASTIEIGAWEDYPVAYEVDY
jgi:hypothetical protein